MKNQMLSYETLRKITDVVTHSRNPEEVMLMIVEGVTTAMSVKGCVLFLFNRKIDELEVAASFGLSDEYLNKGPVSAVRSIAQSLKEGPVAIYDVSDDPRIQYPEEAKREGIASILSVPITLHDNVLGALRVYTAKPWEFTMDDVNFVQTVAQISGMAVEMSKFIKGLKDSIEVLKTMRDPKLMKAKSASGPHAPAAV